MSRFLELHPNAVTISAKTGAGIPELMAELGSALRPIREFLELAVPHGRRPGSRDPAWHRVGSVCRVAPAGRPARVSRTPAVSGVPSTHARRFARSTPRSSRADGCFAGPSPGARSKVPPRSCGEA